MTRENPQRLAASAGVPAVLCLPAGGRSPEVNHREAAVPTRAAAGGRPRIPGTGGSLESLAAGGPGRPRAIIRTLTIRRIPALERSSGMRKVLGLLIVLGFAAAPVFAQKITIDFAHDFDFEKIKTFQYVDTPDSNMKNELMHERTKDAIIRELTEGGLALVESDPDIFVTYHVTTEERTVYNTTNFGYGGYHGGWYGWGGGMGSSTTTAMNYTEGTLIIDAYDATEKKMIWRGTGTVTVKAKPEKVIKQIDKILKKMGNRWDKIHKNQGK
jgi:hypothetical protein